MREKVFIFISIILILVVLIGLNAASYTKQDKLPDNEYSPNRSTFNTGATGTRAFYDLLKETGHKVIRWQEKPSYLLSNSKEKPNVFVVLGETRREISDDDVKQILEWTSAGGKLVLIDRSPNKKFFEGTYEWKVQVNQAKFTNIDDILDPQQMIGKTSALKPVQPTPYTSQINAIQTSQLASTIKFYYEKPKEPVAVPKSDGSGSGYGYGSGRGTGGSDQLPATPTSPLKEDENYYGDEDYDEPPPMATPTPKSKLKTTPTSILERTPTPVSNLQGGFSSKPNPIPTPMKKFEAEKKSQPKYAQYSFAPVVHFGEKDKTILVDYQYGGGQIVVLSEPYLVANNGIKLVDNAQLGINLVSSQDAIIAFDEYHQGYGASENNVWTYFSGTPVPSIIGQICLLIGLVFFVQSRRFGRPLPDGEKNRLSKLEYVSAMAELQQSTKAYDLAIENIYLQFKRHLIRFAGADNSISHKDLANIISERSSVNPIELYNLLNQSEAIMQGERTSKKEVIELTKKMREIEEKLGLKRHKKD